MSAAAMCPEAARAQASLQWSLARNRSALTHTHFPSLAYVDPDKHAPASFTASWGDIQIQQGVELSMHLHAWHSTREQQHTIPSPIPVEAVAYMPKTREQWRMRGQCSLMRAHAGAWRRMCSSPEARGFMHLHPTAAQHVTAHQVGAHT